MSLLLAIDCAADTSSVAVGTRDQHSLLSQSGATRQARELIGMIEQILRQNGQHKNDLTGLVWSAGPGSFTGVRIATSVAQGLGYGLGIPLYPVSSLELSARVAARRLSPGDTVLVADDARMGEVYWARFQIQHEGIRRLSPDSLDLPAAVDTRSSRYATGSAQSLAEFTGNETVWLDTSAARAAFLLPRDTGEMSISNSVSAEGAEPAYLRGESAWKRIGEQ